MMRPPLLSLVLVGISGFCGSPALTITTSVRTLPTPQPASGAAASSIAAAGDDAQPSQAVLLRSAVTTTIPA